MDLLTVGYASVGGAAAVSLFASLLSGGFLQDFFEMYYYSTGTNSLRRTGVFVIDLILEFFRKGIANPASVRMTESLLVFAGLLCFCFLAEASRRRVALSQVAPALLLLAAQLCGVSVVIFFFLALLRYAGDQPLDRGEAAHCIVLLWAMYILMCAAAFALLSFVLLPLSSTAWPGGVLQREVLLAVIFAPAILLVAFAFDATSCNDWGMIKPQTAPGSISDREVS